MTTILPTARTSSDAIFEQLGHGLSQTLPQAAMQRSQRETGLNAIDQLQRGIASANGDMSKILPELMRAYTLNPGLERSGLGQKYLETALAGQYPNALNQGAGGGLPQNQGQPNPAITQPIASEAQQAQIPEVEGEAKHPSLDVAANQYLAQVRPDLINPDKRYGAINTFSGINKQDLSPQEEADLRNKLMQEYKNPNVVNQVVERIREGIKNKHNEALSQYKFDADKINQINDKWNNFVNGTERGGGASARLAPHIDKYGEDAPKTKELLKNKYLDYASKLPTDLTPEQMHSAAMELLQKDITKLDALAAIPAAPPMRRETDVANYLDTNKKVYRDLADQGYIEALREDAFNNKDLGNEEFHSLIWGDQTSKPFLNKVHSIEAPKEYFEPTAHKPFMTYNPKYPQEHQKYISELANRFKGMSDKDDLVLTRAMVLDNGGTIKDFNDALDMAEKNGLKLSQFQKSQLQETNIPRTPPLWEIFSGFGEDNTSIAKALGGATTALNWKPFINYLRGKK